MRKILKKVVDRRHVRYDLRRPALLRFGDRQHPCFVIDVSGGGSRLMVGRAELPESFELLLTTNGAVRRNCRLVWQRGEECGVEFVRDRAIVAQEMK